jgi:hypothetical protein
MDSPPILSAKASVPKGWCCATVWLAAVFTTSMLVVGHHYEAVCTKDGNRPTPQHVTYEMLVDTWYARHPCAGSRASHCTEESPPPQGGVPLAAMGLRF